jgi:hypothetical protein
MDKYYTTVILTSSVNIRSNKLIGDINKLILSIIKTKNEGMCNKDGYILRDSIELIERSIGKVKTINNENLINYNITYKCNIITPSINDTFDCYVDSKNNAGIIAYIKIDASDKLDSSPFIIIIPKEYIDESVFNKININDKLNVLIKSFRIKYKSKFIQLVATLV